MWIVAEKSTDINVLSTKMTKAETKVKAKYKYKYKKQNKKLF